MTLPRRVNRVEAEDGVVSFKTTLGHQVSSCSFKGHLFERPVTGRLISVVTHDTTTSTD